MSASQGEHEADEALSLSSLLKHAVIDAEGRAVGRLSDVVARVRHSGYPLLSGLIIAIGTGSYFVPISDVISIDPKTIRLRTTKLDLRPFQRSDGELLLKEDVLGNRLIDVPRSALVKAYDARLTRATEGWLVTGLDVHRGHWFHFGRHAAHPARDWNSFLLLIGDHPSASNRSSASRVRKLKPAQIADIIESASTQEQGILLAHVHEDPELEASVFEELDEDKQARLLHQRSDEDIAEVLARMRADDAADAIMELPQERRQSVLDLLPRAQHTKVITLLGYHAATAGGLMGPDFLAISEEKTVGDALQEIRKATTHQPEALTMIYTLHADGALAGTLSLVRALQLEANTFLREVADSNLVVASPDDDIIAVTTRMADFNLLSLPVVDSERRMLGIVTVDDALEVAIPRDWSRRRTTS